MSTLVFILGFLPGFFGPPADSVVSFPGADGFGKYTSGGRGGSVIFVTNLNDSGPGSFRDAIKKKEKRIILFSVSGTIALESDLDINYGDVTIAGQSAPGDGICIRNFPVKINADNVIIRYLRFRLGDERKQEADAISGTGHRDIIIDHCSMSWATDECASFYRNKNFTLQWCIISESLNHSVHQKGDHGYGGIWGGERASFHHNLIASHNSRLPRFSGSSTTPNSPDELVDFRNNVIYNWMSNNSYGGEKGRYNMVSNYYKPGPATSVKTAGRIVNPSSPVGSFFVSGNFVAGSPEVSADNKKGMHSDQRDLAWSAVPFLFLSDKTEDALNAYQSVLGDAGASLSRDEVDRRIIEDVRKGTAKRGEGIIDSQNDVGGWPLLKSTEAPADGDKDGMPDEWELKNNLNPKNAADGPAFTISKEYSNIEVYLAERAGSNSQK